MLEEEYEFREAFVGPCPHVISRSENMDSNCCMLMHLENGIKVSKRNKTKEKKSFWFVFLLKVFMNFSLPLFTASVTSQ